MASRKELATALGAVSLAGVAYGLYKLYRTQAVTASASSANKSSLESKEKDGGHSWATVAKNYAVFRPKYIPDMFDAVLAFCKENGAEGKVPSDEYHPLAVDMASGSGQAAVALADRGFKVIAVDSSPDQVANGKPHKLVEYRVGDALATGLPSGSASLITFAQAAHWFDLPALFKESARILQKDGVLAILGYAVCEISGPSKAQPLFQKFYRQIAPYWPRDCDRKALDEGFQNVDFPFTHIKRKWFRHPTEMSLGTFMGYIHTMSAVAQFQLQNPGVTVGPAEELEDGLLRLLREESEHTVINPPRHEGTEDDLAPLERAEELQRLRLEVTFPYFAILLSGYKGGQE